MGERNGGRGGMKMEMVRKEEGREKIGTRWKEEEEEIEEEGRERKED